MAGSFAYNGHMQMSYKTTKKKLKIKLFSKSAAPWCHQIDDIRLVRYTQRRNSIATGSFAYQVGQSETPSNVNDQSHPIVDLSSNEQRRNTKQSRDFRATNGRRVPPVGLGSR